LPKPKAELPTLVTLLLKEKELKRLFEVKLCEKATYNFKNERRAEKRTALTEFWRTWTEKEKHGDIST
jgi:hypothetical protein